MYRCVHMCRCVCFVVSALKSTKTQTNTAAVSMKLKVRQTGIVQKELEVNIRNPNATMANVRAAIAILFKLDPSSFKMVRASSVSANESKVLDDADRLSATGLSDGDLIVLIAKRSRADDGVEVEVEGDLLAAQVASAVAASAASATPAAPARVAPPVQTAPVAASSPAPPAVPERPTVPQKRITRKAATTSDRTTAPHVLSGAEQDDPFLTARLEADNAEAAAAALHGDNSDDEEDDEDFLDEEDDEEANAQDEVQEMVTQLLSVPNILDMRRQFLENPQAVLQQIQTENPRLFQLISANNQAFLDVVENETLLEALREEQEAEEAYIGDSDEEGDFDDEEFDEEEEAAMHEMILNALGAAVAEGERSGRSLSQQVRGAAESAATSATLGRNATQMLDSVRSTAATDADAVNSARITAEGGSETSVTMPRQRGSIPLVISEEDQQKIEGLTQLGFTTEQCTAAFFMANRSIERAANLLFENPPTL